MKGAGIPSVWLERREGYPASSHSPLRSGRLRQRALLILVLSALFSDINGTSEDINYWLTAVIVRGLWDLMISLVLKKLL